MQQTFYIETDEEISSIVDKLNRSSSESIFFVIGSRSLFGQSVVNFKLLKREADKAGKEIIIITQDEHVMKMANKSDIETRKSSEGVEMEEPFLENIQPQIMDSEEKPSKKTRLVQVGSEDFYGKSDKNIEESVSEEVVFGEEEKPIASKEEVKKPHVKRTIPGNTHRKSLSDFKTVRKEESKASFHGSHMQESSSFQKSHQKNYSQGHDLKKSFEEFLDPEKEKRFERVLSQNHEIVQQNSKSRQIEEKNKSNNLFFILLLTIILAIALSAGYFYVPSAEVKVYLKEQDKTFDFSFEADNSLGDVDFEKNIIPSRVIEKSEELMLSYDSTGISESSGQKAKGNIVIYNEYGNSPQTLVATTRFETEDGKIFRLSKNVVVPGKTVLAGESKPGAIEVEVVADQAGDEYNIEPSSFKIPGLKGGDKYEKIYAKSSKAIGGGGLSGDEIKSVSQSDIDSAKDKTEKAFMEKIGNAINMELEKDEIAIMQASKIETVESLAVASVGDVKQSFDYQVKGKGKFFTVNKLQVEEIVKRKYYDLMKNDFDILIEEIKISYESAETDFDAGKAKIKISANISAKPVFDVDKFKNDISSKNDDELKRVLGMYPAIANIEIGISPTFISNLPRLQSRINVEMIDKSE